MSELLENLEIRYLNVIYLLDDYGNEGVMYTNYKVSVIKKWICLFRGSKYCKVTHDPPKIINLNYNGKDDEVKSLLKDVDIPEKTKKRLLFFPKYISVPEEKLFDLDKFSKYLIKRKLDHVYLTREEYDKELPPKRKKLIKKKKRIWR